MQGITDMLKLQTVWVANPNINKSDYPNVNWEDKTSVMKDSRFGSFVDVPVWSTGDTDVKSWLADGDVTSSEVSGVGAPVMALGALALLFML
jgi:hypothetical protein